MTDRISAAHAAYADALAARDAADAELDRAYATTETAAHRAAQAAYDATLAAISLADAELDRAYAAALAHAASEKA